MIAAVGATEILPRYQALRTEDVREKAGPDDLVTIADIEAEKALARLLCNAYPNSAIIGEESATADPSVLRLLESDNPVWILDPVDGTINFAHGRPGFAIIVAYVKNGVTLAGWIHDPLTLKTVTAVRDEGAWCAGRRMTVESGLDPAEMAGSAYGRSGQEALSDILTNSGKFASVSNLLSGAIEYMAIAERERHFLIADKSLPWDHAAGALIVDEAGGFAGFVDGTRYDPRIMDRPVLVASSELLFDAVRSAVRPA
jgi:fructose-1,6-bisphosphatase/inositol monophosphatase family enzyme